MAVQPRMRGERRLTKRTVLGWYGGSAPHARGTPILLDGKERPGRFSPACAGNALPPSACRRVPPVQPRMRGERRIAKVWTRVGTGSAPHARGTRDRKAGRTARGRFSPACAGNARASARGGSRPPVQPRMRGERFQGNRWYRPVPGSAPHARGTPGDFSSVEPRSRFSPACAGNASDLIRAAESVAVQPRMRGERGRARLTNGRRRGSAPHARGTPDQDAEDGQAIRFSPACAGNAQGLRVAAHLQPVQPRMRGERGWDLDDCRQSYGSAPHARGTLAEYVLDGDGGRFSPACAGNARAPALSGPCAAVQPRMRGERHAGTADGLAPAGSAPHARGTLLRPLLPRGHGRFSPACAGNADTRSRGRTTMTVQPRMRGERSRDDAAALVRRGSAPHARGTRH